MASDSATPVLRLRGVRHNNLKGFDLELPQGRLIVVTGLSGSGKSSLAFDTLFAEGQRRYIETFTPYARQFFDRMDKPRVDSIEGIPPAIAIEQRNAVRTTRSTVGTMTEVSDYLKVLWPHLSELHCRKCGRAVRNDTPQAIWQALARGTGAAGGTECVITFDLALAEGMSVEESLRLVAAQGYQRLLVGSEVVRLEARPADLGNRLTVVQDRLRLAPAQRTRFVEACEQAYHFGKGRLTVWSMDALRAGGTGTRFSNRRHCATCDLEYAEPTPALFSFNHPVGACPNCKGFGRVIEIDYARAIPDRSRTLGEGAVKPWQSGVSAECQGDLRKFCQARRVPMDLPFRALSEEHQRWVIEGDPGYGTDEEHQWPRAWYGVKGYFRWLESKAYKMHVRVLLSRYRSYTTCPACQGRRLNPDALLYCLRFPDDVPPSSAKAPGPVPAAALPPERWRSGINLAEFYALSVREAHRLIEAMCRGRSSRHGLTPPPGPRRPPARAGADPVTLALEEVRARLGFLVEVGLGYLTLDRATRTLSGGETERVNLTTCLGSRLVNTLFVLDEPTVGLHPRDTDRLIRVLERLRDADNTVVVVEHEASVMRAADQIVDLGPGHGETGGQVVFQGSYSDLLRARDSVTGQYLSRRRQIEIPTRRSVWPNGQPFLSLAGVTRHNLRGLAVEFPLGRFVAVTGVSGSGKSTLIHEVLHPLLGSRLRSGGALVGGGRGSGEPSGDSDAAADEPGNTGGEAGAEGAVVEAVGDAELQGWEPLSRVVMVDQSPLGRTPRSNPAVYLGAFDDLRELFAGSDPARERGLNASAFSFNSRQGQCERCRGAGFEKIEMQFLSDVFIRCPDCDGRRYRPHILECRVSPAIAPGQPRDAVARAPGSGPVSAEPRGGWSIADLLEASVDEALRWLDGFGPSRPAQRAGAKLRLLRDVGLGYLRLGQPINTLSGGESQRLKLAAHLAEAVTPLRRTRPGDQAGGDPASDPNANPVRGVENPKTPGSTLFLFDEPTTGLHFEDIRVLLAVFQGLVDAGHSLIVIEHNLEVIKCADWVVDLGPDAGDEGGRVVVTGPPEVVAACPTSHTGTALRALPGFLAGRGDPGPSPRATVKRGSRG